MIMSEEDLTKLLVRVDIPDIKTQVITADLKCAGNHVSFSFTDALGIYVLFVTVLYVLRMHANFKSSMLDCVLYELE